MQRDITVVSFDVDGTLIPMDFNNLVWKEELPALVAEKKGISAEDARDYIVSEYERIWDGDLRWYEMGCWIDHFDLDVTLEGILAKYESSVEVFPDVIPALKRLKDRYTLIITTAMTREFLAIKIREIKRFFQRDFSVISDFNQLKTPESYRTICRVLNISPLELLHVGDQWKFDYLAPREAGASAILLDREKERVGDSIIHSIRELKL